MQAWLDGCPQVCLHQVLRAPQAPTPAPLRGVSVRAPRSERMLYRRGSVTRRVKCLFFITDNETSSFLQT